MRVMCIQYKKDLNEIPLCKVNETDFFSLL